MENNIEVGTKIFDDVNYVYAKVNEVEHVHTIAEYYDDGGLHLAFGELLEQIPEEQKAEVSSKVEDYLSSINYIKKEIDINKYYRDKMLNENQ